MLDEAVRAGIVIANGRYINTSTGRNQITMRLDETLLEGVAGGRTLSHVALHTHPCFSQWRFWHSKSGGYFGANINVGAKTRGVCKEQFYCSKFT